MLHGEADALAQVMSLLGNVADRLRRHLGVGSRAKLDAVIDQAGAQAICVHERAVVREGDERLVDCRDMGLGGLPRRRGAGSGVAGMADCHKAGERSEARFVKHLCDQAQVLGSHNGLAIPHSDSRAFLPAVLKRLQAEARHTRDVLTRSEDAEHGTFLFEAVGAFARQYRSAHETISFAASSIVAAVAGSTIFVPPLPPFALFALFVLFAAEPSGTVPEELTAAYSTGTQHST